MRNVLFALALISTSVFTQSFHIEGDFSGSGEGELSSRTIVLDNDKGIIAASAFTGIPGGCSGTIAGIGKYAGDKLKFGNYVKEEDAGNCLITIIFNEPGETAQMNESNCSFCHGPGCAFDGKLRKRD